MEENRRYHAGAKRPQPRTIDGFVSPYSSKPQPVTNAWRMHAAQRQAAARQMPAQQLPKPRPVAVPPSRVQPQPRPAQPIARNPLFATIPAPLSEEPKGPEPKRSRWSKKPKKPKKPWSRRKKIVFRSGIGVLAIVLIVGGYLGYKAISTIDKVFHGNIISDATAAFNSTPLNGESTGRVNILLAGDSADQIDHGGANLTDSILILSVDTQNHTAFLLSIPRDLWVYVPGMNSWQKINAANDVTNFNMTGYPSGGMGELQYIIQTDFNIPIDYYGLMDYGAFRDAVNAVGGVTITINSPDPRGLYDPNTDLKLPNGPVTLDGQQALNLARARGDGYGSYGFPDSDFDRTEHQRQLFIAVAQKAKTLGVLGDPVKISDLINTLGNNYQTNMSLQNVLRLVQITKDVNLANVQSYAFSSTLTGSTNPILQTYTDPSSGEEALIPTAGIGNYGQITQYYKTLTSNNPIAREAPSVTILNGSDVNGLAAKERNVLQGEGFNVESVDTASATYSGTMIVDNTNGAKPNSLKSLQKTFPGTTVTSTTGSAEAGEASGYSSDFVVILGQNWDSTSATTTAP